MGGNTSQKYNSSQSLLFFQFQSHFCFILPRIYMLKNQRIFLFLDLFFKNLDHAIKKWIADSFNQNGDGSGIGTLQVACTVIWHIIIFLDNLHYHLFRLWVNIRMIINCPRYCTDSHTANTCHVLDRNTFHAFTSLFVYLFSKLHFEGQV